MTYILAVAATSEPVTLAELKTHLRIDQTSEDSLLENLITTAREYLEKRTGLALLTQEWRLILDEWPHNGIISINKTPVQSITQIEIYDEDGIAELADLSSTLLDGHSQPARLYVGAQTAPTQTLNGIDISFTAGYGTAADVPDTLKRAIMIHAGHLYEFRGVVAPRMQPASVPQGYDALIGPWLRRSI